MRLIAPNQPAGHAGWSLAYANCAQRQSGLRAERASRHGRVWFHAHLHTRGGLVGMDRGPQVGMHDTSPSMVQLPAWTADPARARRSEQQCIEAGPIE
jgi:hypothetical protein